MTDREVTLVVAITLYTVNQGQNMTAKKTSVSMTERNGTLVVAITYVVHS